MARDALGAQPMVKYLAALIAGSRGRSAAKKLPHTLTEDDLLVMLMAQDARCALSQLPFDLDSGSGDLFDRPFAPSIDRKDNALGYEIGNIRLVCRIVNFGMGKWGYEAFRRAALAIAAVDPDKGDEVVRRFANREGKSGSGRAKMAAVLQALRKIDGISAA